MKGVSDLNFENPNCLFTMQLLDSIHNPPMFIDFGSSERMEKWSQYVESFIRTEDSPLENKKHHVFLQRNLNKKKKK